MGIDPSDSDSAYLKADGVTPKTNWDWWWESQSSQRNLREEVFGPVDLRDRDQYLHEIPRMDSSLTPEQFKAQRGKGSPGSVSGSGDWRVYNATYRNSNERTRAFQEEANALRTTTDEDN